MSTTAKLINARYGKETGIGSEAAVEGAAAQILSHRSLRRYTDDPVSEPMLEVLLACAQSAPTKSNLQQYSIVVVADPEVRKRLAPLCPETGWLETCPVLLVFCADMRRAQRLAEFRNHAHENNNMDTFLNAVVDSAMAMQCFISGAESMGLGCAAISEVRNKIEDVSDALGLPNGVFPIAGLTAGWPSQPGFVNQRLPQSVVVHRDRYDETALEAEVDGYDRMRHEKFPLPPERQRHVDKYGALEFCGWSENVARQLSVPERSGFRDFLLGRGFDLS